MAEDKKEGLEALSEERIEQLKGVMKETSGPEQVDPVTGEAEDEGIRNVTEDSHEKLAEQNEKDLLFESADTWQHMEVPE
ncbi:hypothetical protein [Bifidobacterium cuniculi]|uniref:Uncharacterized protein n=1 Tax=Bifidobacterium cuniculi TaxID=1688 RepID=A0A087AYL2_9BIFI|nr:hypothetical protein [Bifidobacterium cuniculi]KFI63862.1 hypothetical protein BCUN_1474 [Bifidobacterium cuniculi]